MKFKGHKTGRILFVLSHVPLESRIANGSVQASGEWLWMALSVEWGGNRAHCSKQWEVGSQNGGWLRISYFFVQWLQPICSFLHKTLFNPIVRFVFVLIPLLPLTLGQTTPNSLMEQKGCEEVLLCS